LLAEKERKRLHKANNQHYFPSNLSEPHNSSQSTTQTVLSYEGHIAEHGKPGCIFVGSNMEAVRVLPDSSCNIRAYDLVSCKYYRNLCIIFPREANSWAKRGVYEEFVLRDLMGNRFSYGAMRVVCLMEGTLVHQVYYVLWKRFLARQMEKAYPLFREKRKI